MSVTAVYGLPGFTAALLSSMLSVSGQAVLTARTLFNFVWPPVWPPEHARGPIAIMRSAL